jgi:hypothetical protein
MGDSGPTLIQFFCSHDNVLANVGLTGNPFTVKHKHRVTEMTRAFLDYMKSLRVQAPEAINPVPVETDGVAAEPEPDPDPETLWNLKLTAQGYPILPTTIMEKELSKAVCEKLMRDYITQHYRRFLTFIEADPKLITRSPCVRWKESPCAVWRIEEGYTILYHGVVSPGRIRDQ